MDSVSRITIRRPKRLRVAVVKPHVAHNLAHQVRYGSEGASADAIPGDHSEPDLDLVQPGGMRRGKMKLQVRMALQPSSHRGGLMHREVIQN